MPTFLMIRSQQSERFKRLTLENLSEAGLQQNFTQGNVILFMRLKIMFALKFDFFFILLLNTSRLL